MQDMAPTYKTQTPISHALINCEEQSISNVHYKDLGLKFLCLEIS
jgi:hypothetical protein